MEMIYNIIALAGGVVSVVSTVVAWYKAVKNGQKAKAEQAKNAINAEIKKLVAGAEVTFESIDKILKAQNQSAGSMKKRDVVTNLKTFCLENGYGWDDVAMDKAIEDEVVYTNSVNAKKN